MPNQVSQVSQCTLIFDIHIEQIKNDVLFVSDARRTNRYSILAELMGAPHGICTVGLFKLR